MLIGKTLIVCCP